MDMASFNEKNSSWELAKGEYQWMVAASSADVRCTAVQRVTKARKQKVHDAMRAQVPVAVYPMVKRLYEFLLSNHLNARLFVSF